MPFKDIYRQAGIRIVTWYNWTSKYGGLEASDLEWASVLESVCRGCLPQKVGDGPGCYFGG